VGAETRNDMKTNDYYFLLNAMWAYCYFCVSIGNCVKVRGSDKTWGGDRLLE